MHTIPKPEFPRPDRERTEWLNLNGTWEFRLFPAGSEEEEKAFAAKREVYDRSITVPFSWTCPLSEVKEDTAGIGWYRKSVEYEAGERLFLCFGAVDYIADVYVNGNHVTRHQGGYTAFEADITEMWKPGVNRIEVRAEDYRRETQLYGKQGYGEIQGIWQTVWLERRPESYIRHWTVRTKINGEIELNVSAEACGNAAVRAEFGGIAAEAPVENDEAKLRFRIANPRLWSPEDPFLYEGTISLGKDTVHTYFGIREITSEHFDGKSFKWIMLNGKPVYLNGTLDQAFNPRGYFTYPSEEDIIQEAWRLKRLGLNMVRIHIKPEEPRKLYWLDRMGILVMEDIPCFWGEPVEEAKAAYESEMRDILLRDINHPGTFAWVVFNETWGLLSGEKGSRVYLPETQEWVRSIYNKAKALDPTRIVEDNSPCRNDHVVTDLNTWHFYLNGYETVKNHIREVVEQSFEGSSYNYIGENRQGDVPLMNSECGMVWGVEGSAGDSDLAWQYHYMLNEYRLHEKICGFVFTEFHDVVNEFNGYYRIDDTDKDFGYQDFCRGMTLRDLHAPDFLAVDCPPIRTVRAGEKAVVPLVLSSFTDRNHGKKGSVEWELWHDSLQGRVHDAGGCRTLPLYGWGTTKLEDLVVSMPAENAVCVLSLYLKDGDGNILSRNFTTFDVRAELPANVISIPVSEGKTRGFHPVWSAVQNDKLCMGGEGEVSYQIHLPLNRIPKEINIYLEAGAKRVLAKDRKEIAEGEPDMGFMRGYRVDRGAFDNSYWMTDESRFPSDAEVLINGEIVEKLHLENDAADARGVLSWNHQPDDRHLDEAGSYGQAMKIAIPTRMLYGIWKNGGNFELTLRVSGKGGLALYGRNSGRYPHGLLAEYID